MVALSPALFLGLPLAAYALPTQQPFSPPSDDRLELPPTEVVKPANLYLTPAVKTFIDELLAEWDSPGMSVAVVRRDEDADGGWVMEAEGYGRAGADGRPMTGDSLSAIASNSKLFTAIQAGLLLTNESLQALHLEQTGEQLNYNSKIKGLLPEGLWKLWDPVAEEEATVVDLLTHRTGLPRHDVSGKYRKGGVPEMISTLRYLRPSTGFRQGWQYNNLMYETLSELPHSLLNVTFEAYIQEHLFDALGMNSSTMSVAKAQKLPHGQMSEGFLRSGRDLQLGKEGILTAIQPFFIPEGEEEIWRAAGGVLTSARDLTMWLAMLLGKGKHPYTNETVVPEVVIQRCATAAAIADGRPKWPEMSIKGYGQGGQEMYSYQGRQIIEHGGSNIGFKTQVARFPNDNLGIAVLSNDEEFGTALMDVVKWRLTEQILGLPEVDWNGRSHKQVNDSRTAHPPTPYPSSPSAPSAPFAPEGKAFSHPAYGTLKLCPTVGPFETAHCADLLAQDAIQPFLNASLDAGPGPTTYISAFEGFFTQYIRLAHFDGDVFNVSTIFTNGARPQPASRERAGVEGGVAEWAPATSIDTDGAAEWVNATTVSADGSGGRGGWAFRGGFWGKGSDEVAPPLESLGLTGKDAAEVWFEQDA